jgi:predicted TIM-barrel fold metal-dependent hydrolase
MTGAIDIVCNPFTPDEVRNRQTGVDEYFLTKVRAGPELREGVPMARYVEKMDKAGIAISLVPAVRAGDLRIRHSFAIPYERVARYCEQFPGRLYGLAGIDPSRIITSVRELEEGVRSYGFVGAHLYPHWFEAAPDASCYYPFYAKCCELDIPIMLQVGHCLDYQRDRILLSVGRPITLDRVAIDFPELKIIGIHLGWPWTEEMIAVSYKHANVYMAGDAYAPKHWPEVFVKYVDTWGQDKCLFGTDWPVVDPERAMAEVADLGLRPEARSKFLRENALKLFRLSICDR